MMKRKVFGGLIEGYDLTPYYGFDEDCIHWHQTAKSACEGFGKQYYPNFKKQCDEYFQIKHRKEPRGIGVYFLMISMNLGLRNLKILSRFSRGVISKPISPLSIEEKTQNTRSNKRISKYRRGRYAEFNLVYDRGTVFGLQSGVGRIESILMSLPPKYDGPMTGVQRQAARKKNFILIT